MASTGAGETHVYPTESALSLPAATAKSRRATKVLPSDNMVATGYNRSKAGAIVDDTALAVEGETPSNKASYTRLKWATTADTSANSSEYLSNGADGENTAEGGAETRRRVV